jgi:hypothetical protein
MASDDADKDGELDTKGEDKDDSTVPMGAPPILPFDFAREDYRVQKLVDEQEKKDKLIDAQLELQRAEAELRRQTEDMRQAALLQRSTNTMEDVSRPTGYDTFDENDVDDPRRWEEEEDPNQSLIMKFLKDVYIGSPYDNKNKQEARIVVRSVTVISIAIGIIFTGIWYAFPGKFISYRGDTDFTARYSVSYTDPDELLKQDFNRAQGEFFDEASPPEVEQSRFAPTPKPKPNFDRTEDL